MKIIPIIFTLCFLAACTDKNKGDNNFTLRAHQNLGCITIDQVKNTYTPADLHLAFKQCIQEKKYVDAANLFAVGAAYANYDASRVKDKRAQNTFGAYYSYTVISLSNLSKDEDKDFFDKYLVSTKDSPKHNKLCADLKRIGKPNYYPEYMVENGANNSEDLVSEYPDPERSWKMNIHNLMMCDVDYLDLLHAEKAAK